MIELVHAQTFWMPVFSLPELIGTSRQMFSSDYSVTNISKVGRIYIFSFSFFFFVFSDQLSWNIIWQDYEWIIAMGLKYIKLTNVICICAWEKTALEFAAGQQCCKLQFLFITEPNLVLLQSFSSITMSIRNMLGPSSLLQFCPSINLLLGPWFCSVEI